MRNVSVNGKPWESPFKLDFTPDFSKAVILEKEGGEERLIYILPEKDTFSLMIFCPPEPENELVPFRVKLAVKNQIPHENLPPDEYPWPGRRPRNTAPSLATQRPVETGANETTLSIEGNIYGGVFVFEGNTIRFDNRIFYNLPEDITVDGKPWKDITKPFELDYTPDFAKAGILEKEGKRVFYVDSAEKRFALRVENTNPGNHIAPFKVKLAMKNQLPHDEIADYKPVPQTNNPAQLLTGPDPVAEQLTKLWNDGIKEHKIILSALIKGSGTFVFEGNTIRYQHEDGKYPDSVKINGRSWRRLNTESFELPFQIETAHSEVIHAEGENPVKLTQISDKKFEVYFNDPRPPSGTHSTVYSVTIAPGESQGSK